MDASCPGFAASTAPRPPLLAITARAAAAAAAAPGPPPATPPAFPPVEPPGAAAAAADCPKPEVPVLPAAALPVVPLALAAPPGAWPPGTLKPDRPGGGPVSPRKATVVCPAGAPAGSPTL